MAVTKKGHLSFAREIRRGLVSDLVFECTTCTYKRVICTDGSAPKNEINEAAAWGMVTLGKGHYHLEELMAIFEVPAPTYETYQKYEDGIGKVILECVYISYVSFNTHVVFLIKT